MNSYVYEQQKVFVGEPFAQAKLVEIVEEKRQLIIRHFQQHGLVKNVVQRSSKRLGGDGCYPLLTVAEN